MSDQPRRLRLNVCMITPSFYPIVGGLETQVERLIPALRPHGVDAWVVTRRTPGTSERETRNDINIERARVVGGPGFKSLSFTTTGATRVIRRRPSVDVLHAHGIMSPSTVASLSSVVKKAPVIVTLHATYELEHLLAKPLGAARLRLFRRTVAAFVSINDDITSLLLDHGVERSRIVSIPNGIDTHSFAPASPDERRELRASLGLPQDKPVVAFVGRLHPVKQVDVLLRAWARVPEGHLLVIGDGDERQRLEHLAGELALGERARFTGMVSNTPDYLRASDAFVLPSRSEGLSVALLEAMASGAVPVATAVGGAVNLIEDWVNGRLVPPGDEAALAAALTESLANRDWLLAASERARLTVVGRFDLDVVAGQLADLYRQHVAGSSRRH